MQPAHRALHEPVEHLTLYLKSSRRRRRCAETELAYETLNVCQEPLLSSQDLLQSRTRLPVVLHAGKEKRVVDQPPARVGITGRALPNSILDAVPSLQVKPPKVQLVFSSGHSALWQGLLTSPEDLMVTCVVSKVSCPAKWPAAV